MSAASPSVQSVSPNHWEHAHSPVHEPDQSLSTADDFVEIRIEYSPPPGTARTPEALSLAPAASNTNTVPTPVALPPSFADKHPAVTKALATCAANIAFFAGMATSLPLYMLTAPVRLFGTALSLISPKQGEAFTKSHAFKTLTGAMGKAVSIEARNRSRKDLAILGAMDICSFGISFSIVSALDVGQSAFTKTRTTITDTLNNAKQRRLAEEAQQEARRQAQETQNQGTVDRDEDHEAQNRVNQADLVSKKITNMLPGYEGINVAQWENFEKVDKIDTKPLSALLEKLEEGIRLSTPRSRIQAPMKRIADVLILCQESPEIAAKVCEIARLGSASCTDRAATAWLSIEELIDTTHIANHITQLTQELGLPESPHTRIQEEIHKLLTLEHKKHLSEQFKKHLDKDRNSLTEGHHVDYIELLLDVYDRIQKANPTALRELPYRNFNSWISSDRLDKEANQIIAQLEHPEQRRSWKMTLSSLNELKHIFSNKKAGLQKTAKINAFATYLETSDAWTSVFKTLHPNAGKASQEIADQLRKAVGTLTLIDFPLINKDDQDTLTDLFDGFYRLHANQNPTNLQNTLISDKNTILSAAQTQLNEIKQVDTPNIVDAKTLLTQIQTLNEDFSNALGKAALSDASSPTAANVEQLTPFLKQVHQFLETADKEKFSETIMKKTMNNMVLDVEQTQTVPASAKTALKQAYLSTFAQDASEILNAFKLLTPPDTSDLAKFTKEQIIKTFPEPIRLRKIANNAQG